MIYISLKKFFSPVIIQIIVAIISLTIPFFTIPQSISCIAQGGFIDIGGTISGGSGDIILNAGGKCDISEPIYSFIVSIFGIYIIPVVMIITSFGVYLLFYLIKKLIVFKKD